MNKPTLLVEHLETQFFTRAGVARAVDDVSFSVGRGEIMARGRIRVGQVDDGILDHGLIDAPGRVVGGRIELSSRDGVTRDLRQLTPEQMRNVRGNRIAMIFRTR